MASVSGIQIPRWGIWYSLLYWTILPWTMRSILYPLRRASPIPARAILFYSGKHPDRFRLKNKIAPKDSGAQIILKSMKKKRREALFLPLLILLSGITCLYGQDIGKKTTVHFKHASLRQAFTEMERQFGISFSYNERNIQLYEKEINFTLKEVTAPQVLDKIFAGSPLTWSLKGTLVVLST